MTEKTATKPLPVLAILAGTPAPIARYLAQIAAFAGWDGRTDAGPEIAVQLDEENALIFDDHGTFTTMTVPLKASRVIQYLQTRTGMIPADIAIGTYTLKPRDYLWVDSEGQAIRLTEKETAILVCLSQQEKGKPMSRQALLDGVWAYADGVETHTLETHIYRLRQKVEIDPANPRILLTGEDGYSLMV